MVQTRSQSSDGAVTKATGKIATGRPLWQYTIAGLALRLCILQYESLCGALGDRVELATPLTSYNRLKECAFIANLGGDPYDGGVCHQHPYIVTAYRIAAALGPAAISLLYAAFDIVSAYSLSRLAPSDRASDVAEIYLFSPLTLMVVASRSTSTFHNAAVLGSLALAQYGQGLASMLVLSLASLFSVYPLLLVPPVILLARDASARGPAGRVPSAATLVAAFVAAIVSFQYLAWELTGRAPIMTATYETVLLLTDLTPNVGLWWYFFIEMFEDFRSFFLCVFQLHLVVYVAPVCIRLRNDPLFAACTLLGLIAVFKPYPSLADTNLYWSTLPIWSHLFGKMRYTFLLSIVVAYCAVFGPSFYYLWIHTGSGNANFFYAITLVWALAQGWLVSDVVFAHLRHDLDLQDPSNVGKEVVLD